MCCLSCSPWVMANSQELVGLFHNYVLSLFDLCALWSGQKTEWHSKPSFQTSLWKRFTSVWLGFCRNKCLWSSDKTTTCPVKRGMSYWPQVHSFFILNLTPKIQVWLTIEIIEELWPFYHLLWFEKIPLITCKRGSVMLHQDLRRIPILVLMQYSMPCSVWADNSNKIWCT